MEREGLDILARLLVATFAGGLIGLERSYHGRPAGFRTHTLVCVASSLLMLVTVYQSKWFSGAPLDIVRVDPTRMAQGVMTGIGFLGAGVIMREGLTVRGLTTAASIWTTAAIGILAGVGFYSAVLAGSIVTIGILTVFRKVENRMRTQIFAYSTIVFGRDDNMSEEEIRALLAKNGFSVANISYRLMEKGALLEYRMTVRTMDSGNIEKLSKTLLGLTSIVEFNISMAGD
ncbi:MAG TPA: MgtC/SapB family protein [Candidatus Deferrimicrobium sp.]|nr:MgtC/SapB family protein [Candidatus Deferrimicrobium sp.]